ncbi:MAG: LptF/LptG family permease [Chlamydiales bacterium]|nr:LptF/LptG family permease [Chlamydiales bacterium]
MPIFWRYLLSHYLKVFVLSVIAFIFLLVISRLHETASFASLGAPLQALFYFILYQFPYILPVAIPISCLLSALLLMQKLSREHEFIAFRALGKSLPSIIAPLLVASALLSFLNFYIVSEVATNSHLASKQMVQELSSLNPLALLKNKSFLKRRDAFIKAGSTKAGRSAKDVIVAVHQKDAARLSLFFAKKLELINTDLTGSHVSFISSLPVTDAFDHLIIENQQETKTPATEFTGLLKKTTARICPDHLHMRFLLARLISEKKSLKIAKKENTKDQKTLKNIVNSCYSELARRINMGLAPFVFTLMGVSFGIEISRKKVKKNIIIVSLLAAFSFATFFLAKSLATNALLSSFIYCFPLLLIITYSLWTLKRINRGIE